MLLGPDHHPVITDLGSMTAVRSSEDRESTIVILVADFYCYVNCFLSHSHLITLAHMNLPQARVECKTRQEAARLQVDLTDSESSRSLGTDMH